MAGFVDIKLAGGKVLQAKLDRLVDKDAKKIIRSATRKGAKHQLKEMRRKLYGFDNPKTKARNVFELAIGMAVKSIKRTRKYIGVRIVTPSRAFLRIAKAEPAKSRSITEFLRRVAPKKAKDPGFWPAHMELGTKDTPAQSYMRSTIIDTRTRVLRILAVAIGRGIMKSMRKPVPGAK